MNYLIIQHGQPFYSDRFEYTKGMIIINLLDQTYTKDGRDWYNIDEE